MFEPNSNTFINHKEKAMKKSLQKLLNRKEYLKGGKVVQTTKKTFSKSQSKCYFIILLMITLNINRLKNILKKHKVRG